jgi:hypothetical protein
MTFPVIDTNHDTTHKLSELKALGIHAIIRYDNRLHPAGEKQIKPAEAKAIAAAGLRLGIVYEGAGDQSGQFSDAIGYQDAKYSRERAAERGQPDGSAVYFAVDFDANPFQIKQHVIPYFEGVRRAFTEPGDLPKLRVGVYGSGLSCRSVLEAALAELTWVSCSMGWNESHVFVASNRHNLRQHLPQVIAGLDTDPDEINPAHPDIGDFVPFAATEKPQEPPVVAEATKTAEPVETHPEPPLEPVVPPPLAVWTNRNVVMTEFGGPGDENEDAYTGELVDPTKPGVALPARFHGDRPLIRVTHKGKSIDCPLVDVGPHHVNDPYWVEHARPKAESEHGNHAGIDGTPAAFNELGVPGPEGTRTVTVDWSFAPQTGDGHAST